MRLRWSKLKAWKKLFFILSALFLLFWLSAAALFALPVVTFAYFFTMVIKNIMDIHANWKWGSILPKIQPKGEDEIPENAEIVEDDVSMKFPPKDKDPRASKSWKRKKKKGKAVEADGNDKPEISSVEVPLAKEEDKDEDKKEEIKDFEIASAKQQEAVDTTKETSDKDKKDSES